jgi:hypothetical protein
MVAAFGPNGHRSDDGDDVLGRCTPATKPLRPTEGSRMNSEAPEMRTLTLQLKG